MIKKVSTNSRRFESSYKPSGVEALDLVAHFKVGQAIKVKQLRRFPV
jgi:hypothetical protein